MDFNIPNYALIHLLRTLVVFGGNQASRTLENLMWGWHVALSKINKTCRFCIFIPPLKAVNHSSMICDVILAFLLDLHSTRSYRMSRFRKHRGFAALPITKGFSISPDIKPQSVFFAEFSTRTFFTFQTYRFIRKRAEEQSSLIIFSLEKTKFCRMYGMPEVLPNDAFRETGNFPYKGLF